jgi:hypothetical protein
MPQFDITKRVHFGYMREVGPHFDLTEEDMDNLEAGEYGRRAVLVVSQKGPVQHEEQPASPASPAATEPPLPLGTGPDDPPNGQGNPEPVGPFHCPGPDCKFRVGKKALATAAALAAHRSTAKH